MNKTQGYKSNLGGDSSLQEKASGDFGVQNVKQAKTSKAFYLYDF